LISTIIFIVDFPFTDRDYARFGIDFLKRSFSVLIIDCSPLIKPRAYEKYRNIILNYHNLRSVNSLDQMAQIINDFGNKSLAVDLLGSDSVSRQIRLLLNEKKIPYMILQLGILPVNGIGSSLNLVQFASFKRDLLEFIRRLSRRISRSILSSPYPEIALCSGSAGFSDSRLKGVAHRIMAHSFDYDSYLEHQSSMVEDIKPYAVFLDEDMVYHSDYDYLSIKPPATEQAYYKSLLEFFDRFEVQTGLEIIFAAHPRSRYDLRKHLLGSRQFIQGKTAQLVRDATMVLCHHSTSVSFAVLWKKPVVCLTSEELKSSYIGPKVAMLSRLLGAKLFNIDEPTDLPAIDNLTTINKQAYAKYKEMYIKISGTPDKAIWEIFTDYLKNNYNNQR
jgi:hypothetical protein